MADRAATLQLTLEVAAGVPLSASSVAVMATVKAAIKRLGIKTQQDAHLSLKSTASPHDCNYRECRESWERCSRADRAARRIGSGARTSARGP